MVILAQKLTLLKIDLHFLNKLGKKITKFYGVLRGISTNCDPLGENFARLAVSFTV